MTALQMAVFQTVTAATVAGVCLAFIAYAMGWDRAVVRVVSHPLQTVETVVAIAWCRIPARKVHKYRGRHRG